MKTRGRGTFIKPALDYCSFKCALHLQPKLPETSVPVSFNTLFLLIAISVENLKKPLRRAMRREDAIHSFRERKSMGLVIREDAGPSSHFMCVFWTLCVFVSHLGLEAYFVCECLMGLHLWSVWHEGGGAHTVLPGGLLLYPGSSPSSHSLIPCLLPIGIPELTCVESSLPGRLQ